MWSGNNDPLPDFTVIVEHDKQEEKKFYTTINCLAYAHEVPCSVLCVYYRIRKQYTDGILTYTTWSDWIG